MELDGYNKELAIAFEYQGTQHYESTIRFKRDAVAVIMSRDAIKRRKCWEQHVSLIVVPEFLAKRLNDIKAILAQVEFSVIQAGIVIPRSWMLRRETLTLPQISTSADAGFRAKVEKFAADHHGVCVRIGHFVGDSTRSEFRCAGGHQWHASWNSSCQGHWCKKCSSPNILRVSDARADAVARGGTCLSSEDDMRSGQSPTKALLRWKCAVGHEWIAKYGTIRQGQWCRVCYELSVKHTIEDARRIAISRGGLCLSDAYINAITPMLWRCGSGHEWAATYDSVAGARKTWCKRCSAKQCSDMKAQKSAKLSPVFMREANRYIPAHKLAIEHAQDLAATYGGQCLSTLYMGNNAPLEWRCAVGHLWVGSIVSIRRGRWCWICRGVTRGKRPRTSFECEAA